MKNKRFLGALALDSVLVTAFAALGRSSHAHTLDVAGIAQTAWPFLAGMALGHATVRSWHAPQRLWPEGVMVWGTTVVGGMLLRTLTGAGTATSFVIVASTFLALFLLGWRGVAALLARRSAKRA
ncbi:DUF3054 domain-containing protein [Dermabacteraceae bacterium P9123]